VSPAPPSGCWSSWHARRRTSYEPAGDEGGRDRGADLLDRTPPADEAADEAADEVAAEPEDAVPGPDIVPVEPHAPEEPPVDVVGQALAAEADEGTEGVGLAHEPRGASRREEHGDVSLEPAEAEGIAEEVAAALEGEPETQEPPAHLTEPLIDPAEAKALAAEMETMRKAAEPEKG
jgi:hypothetical protein